MTGLRYEKDSVSALVPSLLLPYVPACVAVLMACCRSLDLRLRWVSRCAALVRRHSPSEMYSAMLELDPVSVLKDNKHTTVRPLCRRARRVLRFLSTEGGPIVCCLFRNGVSRDLDERAIELSITGFQIFLLPRALVGGNLENVFVPHV